jgi:hypothetical protein
LMMAVTSFMDRPRGYGSRRMAWLHSIDRA